MTLERTSPHNITVEQELLGTLLSDSKTIEKVAAEITPEHFYTKGHQQLYAAITKQWNDGKPADATTLRHVLGNKIEEVGGAPYLATLLGCHVSSSRIKHLKEMLADLCLRRQLVRLGEEITSLGHETQSSKAALERAESLIYELANKRQLRNAVTAKELFTAAHKRIEHRYEHKNKTTGIPSGLYELDKLTAGWQNGDFVVLAARPSFGKTALGIQFAMTAADKGATVLIFSIEMSNALLADRMVSVKGSVNSVNLRNGYLSTEDWENTTNAIGNLASAPMIFDDTPGITMSEIRSKSRMLLARADKALIVVDYMQLMWGSKNDMREFEIVTENSRGLKTLAKELDVPLIALSQLSRANTQRSNTRPQLSDLRSSGQIEQDADIVMFIHREADARGVAEPEAELIIAKHRNGPCGVVSMMYNAPFVRFKEVDKRYET